MSEFAAALQNGQLCVSPIVRLEMIWGARNAAEADKQEDMLAHVRELPITPEIITSAIAGLRLMAGRSPGYQQVPIPDALIAATAQKWGYGVLMYDRDYSRLSPAFGIDAVWIAAPGSI